MMKRVVIRNLISLVCILLLLTTTVYAWWITSDSIPDVIITTAKMESEIALYKGVDFNYDGILDVDSSGEDIYSPKLEEPTFDFRNISETGVITPHSVIPTEIHTWKVVVTNKGDAVGLVSMNLVVQDDHLKEIFKYFILIVEEKEYYLNEVFSNGVKSIYDSQDGINPDATKEFVIKFELVDYNVLAEKGYTNISLSEYQSIQGQSIFTSEEDPKIFLDVTLSTIN